jgi:TonB family protein
VTVTVTTEPQRKVKPVEVVIQKPAEVQTQKKIEKPKAETPQPKDTPDTYTEAEPINGYEDLYSYFEKELKYPSEVTSAVEGDVSVTFVINKNGRPDQVQFINSLGPEFDKEVIRVINNMPEWKPAMQNGKPVPAKITQSFTFSIKK